MKVSSQADLQNISDDDKVQLTDDITLSGTFNTISTFSGTFDGNGHTISNLTNPFIAEVTDQAIIKNTTFENSDAHIFTENRGEIQSISATNIDIYNTDHSGEEIGILVSINCGNITDCTVSDSSIKSSFQAIGGIAGQAGENSQIKRCSVKNTTLNKGYMAGAILGSMLKTSTNIKIIDCEVSDTDIYGFEVGGITNSIRGSEIKNTTVSNSKLYADSTAGGIYCTGYNNHVQNVSIENTKYIGKTVELFCNINTSNTVEKEVSKLESSHVRGCSVSFVADSRSKKKRVFHMDENSTVSECFVTNTKIKTNRTKYMFNRLRGNVQKSYVNLTILHSEETELETPEAKHSSFYFDIEHKVKKTEPQTRTITHHDELKQINRYDTVELDTDLDFSTFEFETIPLFEGTLNGNGHTIKNVTDTLFNKFQGNLKNVNIQNIQFNPIESGIIATKINEGTLKNIDITMTKQLNSTTQFQTFARIIRNSTISNCNITIKYNGTKCFGIAESLRETTIVKNCVVNLDVKAEKCAGIAKTTIEPISTDSKVLSCTTNGSIKSTTCAGLILKSDVKMENCTSNVNITTTETSQEHSTNIIGGLVGENQNNKIQNSKFSGSIKNTAEIDTIGGIAAVNESTIQNCINNAEISTTKDVTTGGLVGQLNENGIVKKSRNINTITGINNIGGLIGESYGEISNSFNHAKINSQSKNTLIGTKSENSTAKNLYLLPVDEKQETIYGSISNTDPENINTILSI